MRKFTLVILVFASMSCVLAKQTKKGKKSKKPNASSQVVSVKVHHTVCYGKCPDYKIEINKDGTTTYTAGRFAPDTGIFVRNIGADRAAEILALIKKYRVDTCSEMYENILPDLPGLNFVIEYKKSQQSIYSANFGPGFLKEIAHVMDEVGIKTDQNSNEFKKTGMPTIE